MTEQTGNLEQKYADVYVSNLRDSETKIDQIDYNLLKNTEGYSHYQTQQSLLGINKESLIHSQKLKNINFSEIDRRSGTQSSILEEKQNNYKREHENENLKQPLIESFEGQKKCIVENSFFNEKEGVQLFEGACPLQTSWWITKCMFGWITPLINFVNKNEILKLENLGNIHPKDNVKIHIKRLNDAWLAKSRNPTKNSLFFAVISCYKYDTIYLMSINLLSIILTLLQPFLVDILIQYIKNEPNQWSQHFSKYFIQFPQGSWFASYFTEDRQYGITLALVMVFSQGIRFVIDENVQYAENIIGAKASNALSGIIYEKQLRIYPQNDFGQGEIVNFVQTDCSKLYMFCQYLPWIACLPAQLIMCMILLFYYLGISFLSGIGVFIVSFIVNAYIAKYMSSFQKSYMKKQDERVNTTTEGLNNIKMIKMYSWVQTFLDMIQDKRIQELSILKKRFYLGILTIGSYYFFPSFLQSVAFTAYIGTGNKLDLSKTYTILTIFGIIQLPLRMLPMFVGQLVEFLVSMRRIQKFLLIEEINQTIIVQNTMNSENQNVIQIQNQACFIWGCKQKQNEEQNNDENLLKKEENQHKKILKSRKKNKNILPLENEKDQLLLLNSKEEEIQKVEEIQKFQNIVSLKKINLQVQKGQFICIIGDVGSGKSSLLSTFIGDLKYIQKQFYEEKFEQVIDENLKQQIQEHSQQNYSQNQSNQFEKSAPISISGDISYVQQVPWIQNKTIRENIIFGLEFDKKKYDRIIKMCELSRDLEILPNGDLTEIGEKGINLSGGQKARIGLARAVYSDKSIILMDDPISALDANVKKKIFQNVFQKELKSKTRILVTHAIDFLHLVDSIIVIKEGEIILQGSYEQIQNDPYLLQLVNIHKSNQNNQNQNEQIENNNDSQIVQNQIQFNEQNQIAQAIFKQNNSMPQEVSCSLDQSIMAIDRKENDKLMKGKIITDENDEIIKIDFNCYKRYFMNYYGGWKFIILSQLSMTFFIVSKLANDYMIGAWSEYQTSQEESRVDNQFAFYSGINFLLGFIQSIAVSSRAACLMLFSWKATKKLHQDMIENVFRAPVNLYYDTTPIGRILNKFSKDLNTLENEFCYQTGSFLAMMYMLVYVIVVAVFAVKWIAFLLPVIFLISYLLVKRTAASIRETVRLQSTTKSPLLSHLGETMSGASTIRAYGKTEIFIEHYHKLLNDNVLATIVMSATTGWFGIKVDIFAFFLMLILSIICVLSKDFADSVILSMLLPSILAIQDNLIWSLKVYMSIEGNMVNAERCMKLIDIPQERILSLQQIKDYPLIKRPNWPENGEVQFNHVSLKYRPTTEIVLDNLSFSIKKGEKIGVVGRTGAGKSTICLCISRIIEIFQGQILIDGIDIQQIKLEDLRQQITVIPQDATMFTGTLRFNLDPQNKCSDSQILDLIHKSQLGHLIENNPKGLLQEITENGKNLSSGERQLMCICRAILRKSKLVILDEATANIDVVTEQKIQSLIQSEFIESTMITVAHRLNTIMNSDRVLVLSFGKIKEFDSPQALMQDQNSEFSQLLKELQKEKK